MPLWKNKISVFYNDTNEISDKRKIGLSIFIHVEKNRKNLNRLQKLLRYSLVK